MANEEVLGPRKTMFVLVIVVGCFAVLWPRILSPLLTGHQRDQLQPNQFDRDAGCCDVMFGSELIVLELINEVCSSVVQVNGKLSPIAAAQCRKAVNETCGVDIAALIKHSENIGKTSRQLVQIMQSSNSSCLKEHFGVPLVSLGPHPAINTWMLQDPIKQERPSVRGGGPHPALRERGRAIPPGAPPASSQVHIQMPPNVRVRNSPLQGYFELDIKPPPIPGMRPPLGSPGGPVPAPKSSMGFVMPIYTICIIVFFVYTISKLFFKRATVAYEPVTPDPQFRRRVFRDDSRSSPDKLVVTAISGLVAEVQQQMEAVYAQNQRQDAQDNQPRPYSNGTIIHNSGPVHIIASEYNEPKDTSTEPNHANKEPSPDTKSKVALEEVDEEPERESVEEKEDILEKEFVVEEKEDIVKEIKDVVQEEVVEEEEDVENKDVAKVVEDFAEESNEKESTTEIETSEEKAAENIEHTLDSQEIDKKDEEPEDVKESSPETKEATPEEAFANHEELNNLVDLTEPVDVKKNGDIKRDIEDFLREEAKFEDERAKDLLEEAIDEDDNKDEEEVEQEKSSVKVMAMEVTAHSADGAAYAPREPTPAPVPAPSQPPHRTPHEAEEVKAIYLDTAIPQQSRVLVADFAAERPDEPARHSPMVVSGKMTLSLIQDAPRDTPERDLESTVDDFTTASGITQPAEKEGSDSEEEVDEEEIEIEEIEEIEEEVEEEVEEEEEEQPEEKPVNKVKQ